MRIVFYLRQRTVDAECNFSGKSLEYPSERSPLGPVANRSYGDITTEDIYTKVRPALAA